MIILILLIVAAFFFVAVIIGFVASESKKASNEGKKGAGAGFKAFLYLLVEHPYMVCWSLLLVGLVIGAIVSTMS